MGVESSETSHLAGSNLKASSDAELPFGKQFSRHCVELITEYFAEDRVMIDLKWGREGPKDSAPTPGLVGPGASDRTLAADGNDYQVVLLTVLAEMERLDYKLVNWDLWPKGLRGAPWNLPKVCRFLPTSIYPLVDHSRGYRRPESMCFVRPVGDLIKRYVDAGFVAPPFREEMVFYVSTYNGVRRTAHAAPGYIGCHLTNLDASEEFLHPANLPSSSQKSSPGGGLTSSTEEQTEAVLRSSSSNNNKKRKKRAAEAEAVEIKLQADKEAIEIGQVISAQGDDISLEEALGRISMTLKGAKSTFKEEPGEERLVECTRIRYTQDSCSRRFRHGPHAGRLLTDVVEDLVAERLHPERSSWLTLDVVERKRSLVSVDNRRLWCLHEFQRRIPSRTVYAKIRVKRWDPLFDRYLVHLDSKSGNGNSSIHVRY